MCASLSLYDGECVRVDLSGCECVCQRQTDTSPQRAPRKDGEGRKGEGGGEEKVQGEIEE